MIKLIAFVRRNPSMDVDEFHRYWREVHARKILDNDAARRYVVRYEQNHRSEADYARSGMDGGFDGVAVMWFDSADDFYAMISDPGYRAEIAPDEEILLDTTATRFLLTEVEESVIAAP